MIVKRNDIIKTTANRNDSERKRQENKTTERLSENDKRHIKRRVLV